MTSPVAGFVTTPDRPEVDATSSPSIQWETEVVVSVSAVAIVFTPCPNALSVVILDHQKENPMQLMRKP